MYKMMNEKKKKHKPLKNRLLTNDRHNHKVAGLNLFESANPPKPWTVV